MIMNQFQLVYNTEPLQEEAFEGTDNIKDLKKRLEKVEAEEQAKQEQKTEEEQEEDELDGFDHNQSDKELCPMIIDRKRIFFDRN